MNTPNYQAGTHWTNHLVAQGISYPAEYVIRIFKGSFPRLEMPKPQAGQSVLDVGCGDGRHLPFFHTLGLDAYGVEVTQPIVEHLRDSLAPLGIGRHQLQEGSCSKLPFADATFNYLVAWNSAYYMSLDNVDFKVHADEMVRVVRPGGWLVLSVPKPTAFIFEGSESSDKPGCRVIQRDPFGVRMGEIMRVFESREELADSFKDHCDIFCHADIHDDCFGFAYHWYLLVARKKQA